MNRLEKKIVEVRSRRYPNRVPYIRFGEKWFVHEFKIPKFRNELTLPWIEKHTAGRFYLSITQVAFEDEVDFLLYRLSFDD